MDETVLTLGTIVTIACTIICPIIAGYKGRSVVGWLFGGFLLGGIGLIIIACLPKVEQVHPQNYQAAPRSYQRNNYNSNYYNKKYFNEQNKSEEIVLSSSVKSISDMEFQKNKVLKKMTLPFGVERIGNFAFYDCVNLIDISIPDTVYEIGLGAFYNCCSLIVFTIPDGVSKIMASTFHGCLELKNVSIPTSVKFIGEGAFHECDELQIDYKGTVEEWKKIRIENQNGLSCTVYCNDGEVTLKDI